MDYVSKNDQIFWGFGSLYIFIEIMLEFVVVFFISVSENGYESRAPVRTAESMPCCLTNSQAFDKRRVFCCYFSFEIIFRSLRWNNSKDGTSFSCIFPDRGYIYCLLYLTNPLYMYIYDT